ncbi:MAG: TfoX/Sxy family protein [Rhodospirillales bacterium]|nr:TfoX/Sxy family protein [Rhodospirillales bacterium]
MPKDFVAHLQALIGDMGRALPADVPIDCKRFFGGAAAYADGRIFVTLTPVGLAVKLGELDREALMQMGGTPLRYFPKAPIKKAYVVAPENLAGNTDLLKPWLARSVAYALTLPKPKKKKPKKPRADV